LDGFFELPFMVDWMAYFKVARRKMTNRAQMMKVTKGITAISNGFVKTAISSFHSLLQK
jgi:hypothetical protein